MIGSDCLLLKDDSLGYPSVESCFWRLVRRGRHIVSIQLDGVSTDTCDFRRIGIVVFLTVRFKSIRFK
jgi:hypothetical protein